MRAKTILYIITKSNWGGAGRYVYDLALEARRQGYTPVVACGGAGLLAERLEKQQVLTRQIRSLERDPRPLKDLRAFFEIRRIIRETMPAIVHVNSAKAGGIGALAARLCGIPCIVCTVHGLPQREDRQWIAKKIIAFLVWLTALLSHHVIAVAHSDAEILRRQPYLRKKIRHIKNGIDDTHKDRNTAREIIRSHVSDANTQKLLTHPLWIGTIAELTHNKGHRYALEAFTEVCRLYPNVAYIIVGDGELASEHKMFTELHDLADHVFFTGFIPDAGALCAAFDIYLATSVKEGLPYSIIEAMYSGIPIIASAVGGIPDIITDGVSGRLIPSHSPQAITDAIIRVLTDGAYSASLGGNARIRARNAYTKSSMNEETFMLYHQCAQQRTADRL